MKRMYEERKANIPAFRGCRFHCFYCAFQKMLKLSKCQQCKDFEPHFHPESLEKKPPKTKEGEFLTMGLSGDVSFLKDSEWLLVWAYLRRWDDRTFLIQSKDPSVFLKWKNVIPSNVIVGTTIESNRLIVNPDWKSKTCFYDRGDGGYEPISEAPSAFQRWAAMSQLDCRKAVTIEPILDFDIKAMEKAINELNPEIVWIGYDSHPEKNRMIEPKLFKVNKFVGLLKDAGINTKLKLMREPIRTMDA